MFSVTFEVDEDRLVFHKTVYVALFDILALLGGLTLIIYAIFSVLMRLMNYNRMDNWLVSQLYQMKVPDQE